ncbi:MAG: acyltransferase [Verrucomicrobia bacterium]|nr:acyltransferase [Verrucomicrobiota bacterium]
MSLETSNRKLPWDWYDGTIPASATLADGAYLETTYSFLLCRADQPESIRIGHGATVYLGTMFDVGPRGKVSVGQYALVNGAWIICDAQVEIGDYALISWNVVLMDTYRVPFSPEARRVELQQVPRRKLRRPLADVPAKPIRVGRNVWIGFDCCVLPGVTIGEGSIVGARSVVTADVPPYTIVAGNPARIIRQIENDERAEAS